MLPEVTARLDADVEGFIRAWDRAADAAERAAARIRAAQAGLGDVDIDTGRYRDLDAELQRLTTTVRHAADQLREFGNSSRNAGGDVDHLGERAREAANNLGGGSGGLGGAMAKSGMQGKLMAAAIAVIASVLPAVAAAALAAGAALAGMAVVAGVVIGGWHGIEQAGKQLKATLNGLKEQLDSVFRSGLSQEFTKLGHSISALDGPLTGIARSVVGVVKEFTGWIRSTQGMEEIKSMLGGVDNMVKALGPGVKAVAQMFTAWGAAASPVLGKIGEAISYVFKELNNVIQKAKETGQLQKAFEAGADAIKAFGDILAGVIDILIEMAAQGGKPAAEALKKFGQALKDAAPLIGLVFHELASAMNVIMTVVAWLAKLAAALQPVYEWMNKALDAIDGVVTALGDVDGVLKNVGGAFVVAGKAIATFATDSKKNIDKWKDDTNKSINQGLDSAKKSVDKWKDDTNKAINTWVADCKKSLDKWKDDTNKSINKGVDDAKKSIDKWKDDTNKSINDLVNSWIEAVEKWWDDTMKSVGEGIDKVVKFLAELPQKAMDALKDWVHDMTQLGKDAIDGIAKGIQSAVGNLVGAATKAAKAALDAIKSTLGIRSPSIVFKQEVGEMIPAGIADGIIGNAGRITDAMNRTGSIALAGGKGMLGGTSGVAGRGGQQTLVLQVGGGADTAVGTMIARLAQQGKLKITANAVIGR